MSVRCSAAGGKKAERCDQALEHCLSHDDMVLAVNWETATDQRNTPLNRAITADAKSGYVYRLDVDFDPRVKLLDHFNDTYTDGHGNSGRPARHIFDFLGTKSDGDRIAVAIKAMRRVLKLNFASEHEAITAAVPNPLRAACCSWPIVTSTGSLLQKQPAS